MDKMPIDMRDRLTRDMREVRKAGETAHIIQRYGFTAWYTLSGMTSLSSAREFLEEALEELVKEERYEDCAIIRDTLVPIQKPDYGI